MFINLRDITDKDTPLAGKKAVNLSRLIRLGYTVPEGFCISTDLYRDFVTSSGIDLEITKELARRDLQDMRWEELWDASLRIRNLFITTDFTVETKEMLVDQLIKYSFASFVVRSSSPGEDTSSSSFAGLHESVVDVQKTSKVLEAVKTVWASLWSDSSLLYRKELNLQVKGSSMGVVIQELVRGEVSGVAFSQNPSKDTDEVVVECVSGLNENLVDGKITPFRYILSGDLSTILSTDPGDYTSSSLLSEDYFSLLKATILSLKKDIPYPFDLEWTIREGELYLLQIRPITTLNNSQEDTKLWEKQDKRPWYRSLSLTFDTLEKLRDDIEENILPEMKAVEERMKKCNIKDLSDEKLLKVIGTRKDTYSYWKDVYWENLIPFAHGARLFGKIYNDRVKPKDPYEFTRLLSTDQMASIKRNSILSEISEIINSSSEIKSSINSRDTSHLPQNLIKYLEDFMELSSTYNGERIFKDISSIIPLLLNITSGYKKRASLSQNELEENFMSLFDKKEKDKISRVLSLARASWQLRDDDNIYLGGIEAAYIDAFTEGKRRLLVDIPVAEQDNKNIPDLLTKEEKPVLTQIKKQKKKIISSVSFSVRRFSGQPASPGIGTGTARIISSSKELLDFKEGEILVCDAIDPNMTFIVPLASAIIERRGGMLIHGAIIAREYGIPCVTGITNALTLISTGDKLVVDGYSGSVSITRDS